MKKDMQINMTGKEYMQYMDKKKIKLSKTQIHGCIILCFCALGVLIIAALISDLTYTPTEGIIPIWIKAVPVLSALSWSGIAKFLFVLFAPIIAISWLIHGVQFRILA